MSQNPTRRTFLRTAPIAAAAAGLALAEPRLVAAEGATPEKFQVFTAQALADDAKGVMAKPGNNLLVQLPAFSMVMTTEVAHSAKEFEWHEERDHIIQILDGTTVYELGGTPLNGRVTKPGEHMAPDSKEPTKLTLRKGDMLTIPRGILHRRSTEKSVTFILISPQGLLK